MHQSFSLNQVEFPHVCLSIVTTAIERSAQTETFFPFFTAFVAENDSGESRFFFADVRRPAGPGFSGSTAFTFHESIALIRGINRY